MRERDSVAINSSWAWDVLFDMVFTCVSKFLDVLLNFESVMYVDGGTYVAQLCSKCSQYLA